MKVFAGLLSMLLLRSIFAASIVPTDLCKLYVGSRVFDLRGISHHADLPLTKTKEGKQTKFTVGSSLCGPIDFEKFKKRALPKGKKVTYSNSGDHKPRVIFIREKEDAIEAFNLAVFGENELNRWTASVEDWEEQKSDQTSKNNQTLRIAYSIPDHLKSPELGIDTIDFKFVCYKQDDFEFYDERIVGSSLILQYNGKKACSINYNTGLDTKWNIPIFLLAVTSIYGLFLDKDNERIVMTLSTVQGSFMVVAGIYLAFELISGPITQDKDTVLQFFSIAFMFLSIGLGYFSRYVSLFFVCIASSFALNCTLLYTFCLMFGVYVPAFLFYMGGLVCAVTLLSLYWFNTAFREKYSFTVVVALTNSFYLCGAIAYSVKWTQNIFTFNEFKDFGKIDRIQFKHWVFLLLEFAIAGSVIGFRLHQARKEKEKAMAKNAALFKKERASIQEHEGYFQPDRGDDDPLTVIAM